MEIIIEDFLFRARQAHGALRKGYYESLR